MNQRTLRCAWLGLLVSLGACAAPSADADWEVLFDGESLTGWRAYQGAGIPETSWCVEDGAIVSQATRGEIVTESTYRDFELEFAWKVTDGANSGVFYRVDESDEQVHHSGMEYQVLDNVGQAGRPLTEQAGACYGVVPAIVDATLAVGEWNEARIVVRGDHAVHRLNGQVVAEFWLGSEAWEQGVARGPLSSHAGFGKTVEGPIALQNYHGHRVAFRDLRIRRL